MEMSFTLTFAGAGSDASNSTLPSRKASASCCLNCCVSGLTQPIAMIQEHMGVTPKEHVNCKLFMLLAQLLGSSC